MTLQELRALLEFHEGLPLDPTLASMEVLLVTPGGTAGPVDVRASGVRYVPLVLGDWCLAGIGVPRET